MTDWPSYRSHKIVQAAPIVAIGGDLMLIVEPHPGGPRESFSPNMREMAAKANIGDYAVKYEDGYKSVSPRDAFEDGYSEIQLGSEPDADGEAAI